MTTARTRPADTAPDLAALVLNELQSRFPLEEDPYGVVAGRLGTSPDVVRGVLTAASDSGLLRQVSAIFDTRSLGYRSTLAAMRVAPAQIDHAVAVLNAHPGISHNYERDHDFNVWFTIATPPSQSLEGVLASLGEMARAESLRALPAIRTYKIGVTLDVRGHARGGRADDDEAAEARDDAAPVVPLSPNEIDFVRAAQRDLAREYDPFVAIAQEVGRSPADVIESARRLQAGGRLRRFAALVNHRRAGFSANGMAVWPVPEDRVDELGPQMASFRAVTHCYRRPAYEDWPYSLFTMVHGANAAEVESIVAEIAQHTGLDSYRILYSSREFKKTRLAYFTPEHDQWHERCSAAATGA